jgi:hypothetical protein
MPTPPNQNPSFGRTARQDEEDVKTLAMLTQLHPKTSEVKVFQLRKKKVSMPTQENSWKRSFSGAFPELLRSFYGELLRRPRFLPQIFKFGGRGVKVCGQSLWSEFSPEMRKMVLVRVNCIVILGQVITFVVLHENTRCFVKMKANVIQLQKY